jgi:hypothetical protein
MVSHPQELDSAGVLASEDHARSHSRFEIQISTRLSFPSLKPQFKKNHLRHFGTNRLGH